MLGLQQVTLLDLLPTEGKHLLVAADDVVGLLGLRGGLLLVHGRMDYNYEVG